MLCSSWLSLPAAPPAACRERAEISNSHARKRKDMADMAAAMEREFAEAEAEARQEFEAQREEIRNKNAEEYNVQKLSLEVGGMRQWDGRTAGCVCVLGAQPCQGSRSVPLLQLLQAACGTRHSSDECSTAVIAIVSIYHMMQRPP